MPVQDLELALDSERRGAEDARQAATLLERKRIALQTELEDLRAVLDAVSSLSLSIFVCVSAAPTLRVSFQMYLYKICEKKIDFIQPLPKQSWWLAAWRSG